MKTILTLALFGVLMTSTGCEQEKLPERDTEIEHTAEEMIQNVIKDDAEIIIIDDCEYIIFKEAKGNNQGYGFMSHKGNCKNPIHNYRTPDTMKTQ
jgi:hypothetical protein